MRARSMKVVDMAVHEVESITTDLTVKDCALVMRRKHVGSLVVVDGQNVPVGIITDRDLAIEVLAQGLDPLTLTVGEVMTTPVAVAQEDENVIDALARLRERGVRRLPVVNAEGLLVGRELGGSTVGLIGMTPAARPLAQLLGAFGARVIGYDPAVHSTDALWHRWKVEPVGLRELLEESEAVSVMLSYFSRYHGLLGERFLPFCRPNQVLVSIAPSSVFDEASLAEALGTGRMAAAWFDSLEPGMLEPGRPLHDIDTLQITPRVASTTRESRVRSAWGVARRIDELLTLPATRPGLRGPAPTDDPLDLAAGGASG